MHEFTCYYMWVLTIWILIFKDMFFMTKKPLFIIDFLLGTVMMYLLIVRFTKHILKLFNEHVYNRFSTQYW